jgi:UDP:flavonoid glycosyltransferase YjiC (YdhE family)
LEAALANIIVITRPYLSHLFQTFNFANDLMARGHIVTYASGDENLKSTVESHGFQFYRLRQTSDSGSERTPSLLEKIAPPVRNIRRMRRAFRENFRSLTDDSLIRGFIEEIKPSIVVLESNLSIYAFPLIASKVPVIIVCPTWPGGYRDNVPHAGSHLIPDSSPWSRRRCQIEFALTRTWRSALSKLFSVFILGVDIYQYHRRVAEHYGLSLADLVDRDCAAGTSVHLQLPTMCLCPAAFDFPRKPRPNLFFLDSGIRPENVEEPFGEEFPWRRLKLDAPLVFCAFGSLLPEKGPRRALVRKVLKKIIEAFSRQNQYQLVICVWAGFDLPASASATENVIIVKTWAPQVKLLPRASVHITHGGFSSVRESIECQVPMIVIPFSFDQPGIAARVVYHKLGVRVFPRRVNGEEIIPLVQQVAASAAYKENLKLMKHAFDEQREKQSAADMILNLLPEKS